MENKIQKVNQENDKLVWQESKYLKDLKKDLEASLSQVLENQKISKKKQDQILETTQRGFITLAIQNSELLEVNQKLNQQLNQVVEELNQIKKEREERAIRKEAHAKRKRLPKRDPMTAEIYKKLIQAAQGPTYIQLRTRIGLCILAVTGIRINELLPLKVHQLKTLTEEYWIAIDRSKRGPTNHKAFLTKEGKKIIREREKDFRLMFLMKEPDSYIFTAEDSPLKKLNRARITIDVNKVMHQVASQLPDKPNITSHSFRIGYITQLWKDSQDIEFVKQTIGHRKLDTTSSYVTQLSDQERKNRTSNL